MNKENVFKSREEKFQLKRLVFFALMFLVLISSSILMTYYANAEVTLAEENFDSRTVGEVVYAQYSTTDYVTVAIDPGNSNNKVGKREIPMGVTTNMWFPKYSFSSSPITGEIIIEAKVRFEGPASSFYSVFLGTSGLSGSNAIWTITSPYWNNGQLNTVGVNGEYNSQETLTTGLKNDRWYLVKSILRTDTKDYDIYLYDLENNVMITSSLNRTLRLKDSINNDINYTSGITFINKRFYGYNNGSIDGNIYIDNSKVSKLEDIDYANGAVEKAEESNLQTDVDSARTLVNALPSGSEKTSMTSRLDAVQNRIDSLVLNVETVASDVYKIDNYTLAEAVYGEVVLEQTVKFEGKGDNVSHGLNLEFVSLPSEIIPIWRLQSYHNSPGLYVCKQDGITEGEDILAEDLIKNDVWYKVKVVLDLNANPSTYDIYLIDITNNTLLAKNMGRVVKGSTSYSQGITEVEAKSLGTAIVGSYTYTKDLKLYKTDITDDARINLEICSAYKKQCAAALAQYYILALEDGHIKDILQNSLDILNIDISISEAEESTVWQDVYDAQSLLDSSSYEINKDAFQIRLDVVSEQLQTNTIYSDPNNYLQVSEPVDLETQEAAYNNRNNETNIEALAKDFFGLIDFSKPGLEYTKRMMIEGNYKEAIRAFKVYYLGKLRTYTEEEVQMLLWTEYYSDPVNTNPYELMNGIIVNSSNQKAKIGVPGRINWAYDPPLLDYSDSYARSNQYMWGPNKFNPLIDKYVESGNVDYLNKWNDFMDDWSMHQNGYVDVLAPDISDSFHNTIGGILIPYMINIHKLSKVLSEDGEGLDDATFIRALNKMYQYLPQLAITYIRSNPQNWSEAGVTSILKFPIIYDEFKDSDIYLQEGIRILENLARTHKLPDGTAPEQDPIYNRNYFDYTTTIELFNTLNHFRPEILTTNRLKEIRDMQNLTADFFTHILTPLGKYPAGFRIDYRDQVEGVYNTINRSIPEALSNTDNASIFNILRNKNYSTTPSFNSEFYPYGGYYSIKEGWNPESQNAFMFSSSNPGVYGRISNWGNNTVSLSAYGQDMLVLGEIGHYGSPRAQLTVDTYAQNAIYGLYSWAHRNIMAPVWDEPSNVRWHTGAKFDIAEGIYDGKFGKTLYESHIPETFDGVMPSWYREVEDNVSHQRLLKFLREEGLWIITDRLSAENDSHNYSQFYRLPVGTPSSRATGYKAYTSSLIQVDNTAKTVKTQDDNMANLSIYQFSSSPITIATSTETVSTSDLYRISDFYKVQTSFSGAGSKMLISVLYPRENKSDELSSITPITGTGISGFTTTVSNGKTISYVAADNKDEVLTIGDVTMTGEALLIVETVLGEVYGHALGCTALSISNVSQSITSSDFEFYITNNSLQVVEDIYKPLKEVIILPEADTFVDNLEVTLSSLDNNVDIYYTLDGSEPTLQSTKYTEPFNISSTTMVKAKSYRQSVQGEPNKMNGTLTSAVRTAVFTKMDYLPASMVTPSGSGLNYEYYEDDWQKMFTSNGMNRLVPTKSGNVSNALDVSPKETTTGTFGFRYSGYIDIPSDGVYTFYAPNELYNSVIVAGYELNLFVDNIRWSPIQRKQSFGTWSIPLKKGYHHFRIDYVDYRGDSPSDLNGTVYFTNERVWGGTAPGIMISGPGLTKQVIPSNMLYKPEGIAITPSFYIDYQNAERQITEFGLVSGTVNTKVNIKNDSASDFTSTVILVVNETVNQVKNIVGVKILPTTTVSANSQTTLETDVEIPEDGDISNYDISIMLWDDIIAMKPLFNRLLFKDIGPLWDGFNGYSFTQVK